MKKKTFWIKQSKITVKGNCDRKKKENNVNEQE